MTIAKVIARAWSDAAFKKKLLHDPHAALAEHGVEVPSGVKVSVVEDTGDTRHLVLPITPDAFGTLNLNELENVAAGMTEHWTQEAPIG